MGDKTTFSRGEMLKHNDVTKFHTSEVPEIDGLQNNDVWEIKLRQQIPKCKKILRSVWAHRIKQRPDGTIKNSNRA